MDECVNEVSQEWVQYKGSLYVLWMQPFLSESLQYLPHQQEGVHQVLPVSLQ